jgi:endonuclease/exonuclease/phosphatase (EEP) superfamily protein YafD
LFAEVLVDSAASGEATLKPARWGRPRHRRKKRRLPDWAAVIGWLIVLPLAVVALVRIFAWDDLVFFALVNTVSLFVYLPAWIVAIAAGIGRRYVLAGAALLIVVAQLFFVLPEFTAAQPAPSWSASAPSVRLLDANVFFLNATAMSGYASQIKAYRPQLVTMEEATPLAAGNLKKSGALADLPFTFEVSRYDPRAFFIASKYRLSGSRVVYFNGVPLIAETTIHLPSRTQSLWVVHTAAPVHDSFAAWKKDLAFIAKSVKARGPHGLLLIGDFNSTWGNKGFRSILGEGMTDGAAARGRALEMTWSQLIHPLPPLVRIDHVLTGPGVAVTSIRTDVGVGSDHRDVMATVAFQRQAASP